MTRNRTETPITTDEVEARRRNLEDVLAEAQALDGQMVELSFPHWRRVGQREMEPVMWTMVGTLSITPDDNMRDLTEEHGDHDWISLQLDGHWATYLDEMVTVEPVGGQ